MRFLGTAVLTMLTTACATSADAREPAPRRQGTVAAAAPGALDPVRPAPAPCSDRSVREIRLPEARTIDAFVVDLDGVAGPDAQTRVELQAGDAERVLTVGGDGARALRFSPGLRAQVFRLELATESGAPLCVDRITLLSSGGAVAVVRL